LGAVSPNTLDTFCAIPQLPKHLEKSFLDLLEAKTFFNSFNLMIGQFYPEEYLTKTFFDGQQYKTM